MYINNFFINDFIYCIFTIILSDYILCFLFNKKGRYFQLHCFINFLISYRIFNDVINIIINPICNYKLLYNNNESYLILILHIYHLYINNKLNIIEKMHHIIFVGFGIIPTILFINTNQIYLGYISCCGIPGIFEYGLLTLQNKYLINKLNQKYYTIILYNYFRYPLAIYGCIINLTFYKYSKILQNDNIYLTIYINILLYLNGCVFNHLTLKSYYKCKKKII